MKICISAESTIDLPKELLKEFDIKTRAGDLKYISVIQKSKDVNKV